MIRLIAIGEARSVSRGVGASHARCSRARAAGQHDHGNRCCLRRGQNSGERCLRGTNNGPANPSSRPQMRDENELLAPGSDSAVVCLPVSVAD